MVEGIRRHLKDIIIAAGVFVPLLDYLNQLLDSYGGSVNVLDLTGDEQFFLLALIVVPLLVLRLVYAPLSCSKMTRPPKH